MEAITWLDSPNKRKVANALKIYQKIYQKMFAYNLKDTPNQEYRKNIPSRMIDCILIVTEKE